MNDVNGSLENIKEELSGILVEIHHKEIRVE
jgi:hypothetical protein